MHQTPASAAGQLPQREGQHLEMVNSQEEKGRSGACLLLGTAGMVLKNELKKERKEEVVGYCCCVSSYCSSNRAGGGAADAEEDWSKGAPGGGMESGCQAVLWDTRPCSQLSPFALVTSWGSDSYYQCHSAKCC